MSNIDNILSYFQKNREKIRLLAYFAIILAVASPLAGMLATAWNQAALTRFIIRLRLFVGADHQAVSISVFGLYVGLLVLLSIDPKKRWQAFLLWIGTGLALLALQSSGKFLPNVNLIGRIHLLLGGLVVGLLIGGGRKVVELRDFEVIEFRRASQILYFLLSGFTILSLIELHINYPRFIYIATEDGTPQIFTQPLETAVFGINPEGIITNIVISAVFVVTLRQFVQYDAEKRFFILGPRASGKSLFLIGAFKEALERTKRDGASSPLNPSQDLASMVDALDRQESEWIVEATGRGELKNLRFQYVYGSVFPTNIQISAFDYAGEYLHRIPDALTGAIDEDDMDTTLRRLGEGVRAANTLILVVDVERFVGNEPLDIEEYFSILQATDDKQVILVATKADVLLDDFKNERGLDAHVHFDEFKEFITTRLRQSKNVDALIQQTGRGEIHPVYYQTTVNENGNRVPMRDERGMVMTVGFDEFLDKIGRM